MRKAFPQGIPEAILSNELPHDPPYPGDNGIRFEPVPGVKRGNPIIDQLRRAYEENSEKSM